MPSSSCKKTQPDVDASIEEGLAARHEWQSLEERIRPAENQKKAASDLRLRSVRFSAYWTQIRTDPSSAIPTATYAGQVSVPLSTGGRIRAETVRADLDIQKLRQQQADLRNQIALDVKTALIFFFNDPATTEIYTLSLHDALPISD